MSIVSLSSCPRHGLSSSHFQSETATPRDYMSMDLAAVEDRYVALQCDDEPLGSIVTWSDVDRMHAESLAEPSCGRCGRSSCPQCDGIRGDDDFDPPTGGGALRFPQFREMSDEDLAAVVAFPFVASQETRTAKAEASAELNRRRRLAA